MRILAAMIAALALVVAAIQAGQSTAVATGASTTRQAAKSAPGTPAVANYVRQAVKATNARRSAKNLKRLKQHSCLRKYAKKWAKKMAARQQLVHQSLKPILRRCDLHMTGENIAVGYPNGRAVVKAWMASPPHRRNILTKRYRLIAIGAYRDADGRWWSSQLFGAR